MLESHVSAAWRTAKRPICQIRGNAPRLQEDEAGGAHGSDGLAKQ
jgi:hypothetical protein